MSTVIILTPVIIGGWPVITAAVSGAAAALGFVVRDAAQAVHQQTQQAAENVQSAEIELENSEVLAENLATDEAMVVEKGGIQLKIWRDERGRCRVCAEGKGRSKAELESVARQFSERLTQCFVYNRVMSELKARGFQVVNEEMTQDESVRIHVRRWEG